MNIARQESLETAKARANIYGLLAAVFRAEPTVALVQEIMSPAFSGVLSDLGLSLTDSFRDYSAHDLAADLALEYTRLFIGPGPRISPHGSLHVDLGNASENMLWSRQTVAVKRFIEATGLSYDENFSGMPDHISAEFEFMAKLAQREATSWAEGDEGDAYWCREAQEKFLKEHIQSWVPRFCDKVITMAESPFYRQMAEVTKVFLSFEREEFGCQSHETNQGTTLRAAPLV
jgi:anaerobic sulfite reductase subunit A